MCAQVVEDDASAQRRGLRGLVIATYAFLAVLAASAVPIPLYSEFKATIGLTDTDIASTTIFYLCGVMITLFFAGSLSDAAGRRPLTAVALLLAMLGSFMFLHAEDTVMVLAARAVQGVASGFAMSAISALVVDSAVGRYQGVGMAVAGCGALLGITIGSMLVGLLSLVIADHSLFFVIAITFLLLGLVGVPFIPETVIHRVPVKTACKPVFSIDPSFRRVFPLGAIAYITGWGVGTYYQSFSSPVAVQCFGLEDPLVASVILALSMAPSMLGAPIEARMRFGTSLRVSMIALLVCSIAMCITIATQAFIAFLVFVTLFGITTGMCLSGTFRLLFAHADQKSSAIVVSTINLVGYAGSAVLNVAMGALVGITTLLNVLIFMTVFAGVATLAVAIGTRRLQAGA